MLDGKFEKMAKTWYTIKDIRTLNINSNSTANARRNVWNGK